MKPIGRADTQVELVRGGLHRLVTQQLGQSIAAGELPEGSQIVPEEVCERLGVSRTVVREALRVLTAKGMVTASPRSGTRVTPVERWGLLDSDVIGWRVNGPSRDEQLRDLLSLRMGVEPLAARGAAEHASPSDVDDLLSSCAAMEDAATQGIVDRFTAADIRFHTRLLTASGNLIYRQFAAPVEAVLRAREELDMMPPRLESVVVAHHREIAMAVRDHDADRAEMLTRELIDTARSEIFAEIVRPPAAVERA